METRQLGNTDMYITPIGFGAWAIGGRAGNSPGAQDDRDSIAAIHEALDAGINWIDTAAVYGLGHSEEVVARALEGVRGPALRFYQVHMVWDDVGRSATASRPTRSGGSARPACGGCAWTPLTCTRSTGPNPDEEVEEGWATLAQLQKEGKVRHIGVSNFNVAQMKRAQAIAPVTSLQPPYSLLHREIEDEILPFVARRTTSA